VRDALAERAHDLGGSRGSGALHERSRRDTIIDGSAIAGGGLRRGDDMHGHATVVRQNDMAAADGEAAARWPPRIAAGFYL